MAYDWRCEICDMRGFGCRDEAEAMAKLSAHVCGRSARAAEPPLPSMKCVCDSPEALTDAQVQTEIARRWPGHQAAKMWMGLCAERDDWKRRAEAAEALLAVAQTPKFAGRQMVINHPPEPVSFQHPNWKGCAICGAPPNAPCTASCNDDRVPDANVRQFAESGPGIGSHPPDIHKPDPDNAHYVDPLDLLCEDA